MPGVKDLLKRGVVRKLLKKKKWQESSDRAVAIEAGVSRHVATEVRRLMIAAGEHPPRAFNYAGRVGYKPGTSARGGYVYDENGNVIRETIWLRSKAGKGKKAK